MGSLTNSLALLLLGYGLLVLQSAIANQIGATIFAPNLMIPIVIFLGVSPHVHLIRGAIVAFLLGYLLDLFCGNLMSIQTLVTVATYVLARGAGLRLFLRSPAFQFLLTFAVTAIAGGAIVALKAIFKLQPFGSALDIAPMLAGPALSTAIASPLIFPIVRRLDALSTSQRSEGASTT